MSDKHYTYGGNGSHWDGCHESHWDCRIRRLEQENERLRSIVDKMPTTADGKTRAYVGMNCFFVHKNKVIEAGILSLSVDEDRDNTIICRVRSEFGWEYVLDVDAVLPLKVEVPNE